MSIAKTLIQKEIGRLKRGIQYAKETVSNEKFKGDKSGYRKTIELNDKDLKDLEKDLKKL